VPKEIKSKKIKVFVDDCHGFRPTTQLKICHLLIMCIAKKRKILKTLGLK
jgi:hypothetical protein